MDCIIHGVTKSQTQLSDFHLIFLNSSRCLLFKAPPHLIFPNSVNDTITVLSSKSQYWGFPVGPVVETLCFHCRDKGWIPFQATEILHTTERKKKKKTKNPQYYFHFLLSLGILVGHDALKNQLPSCILSIPSESSFLLQLPLSRPSPSPIFSPGVLLTGSLSSYLS